MNRWLRVLGVSAVLVLVGCASPPPLVPVEAAGTSVVVVSFIDAEVRIAQRGPVPFASSDASVMRPDWGLRERAEDSAVSALEAMQTFRSIRVARAPVGTPLSAPVFEGADLVLLLHPVTTVEPVLATQGLSPLDGVGVRQRSGVLGPRKTIAYASVAVVVASVREQRVVRVGRGASYTVVDNDSLGEGALLASAHEEMAKASLLNQLGSAVRSAIALTGLQVRGDNAR